jgi:hypothetical protein
VDTGFCWGNLREDPGVDGRTILRWFFRKWGGDVCTGLIWQDRDRWWTLVNAVMNLRAPKNAWSLLTSSGITSFSRRALVHGIGICLVTIKYAIFIQITQMARPNDTADLRA